MAGVHWWVDNGAGAGAGARSALTGVPEFRLVDVPGMGFTSAEAVDEGKRASWRALLERYLTVRRSLCTVFHLVDAKAGAQSTDVDLMKMTARALRSRSRHGSGGLPRYVVVLTKADRVQPKDIAKRRRRPGGHPEAFLAEERAGDDERRSCCSSSPSSLVEPEIIVTSSKARRPSEGIA